jgi:NADH-quinone oxidoreductase subunit G
MPLEMKMARLVIDGKTYEVDIRGRNLLEVCLSLGFDLPYFCWHPAMHSVGACRQCAVKLFKDENDSKGRIVMSCMTQAVDGMRLSVSDPEAVRFRSKVLEWLMVNHPHDCPVCDEGGECHLQDMTVMTGHVYRSYRFDKRTHVNQDLGPRLNHEMNRCIQCYRCVRFYRDYAGGKDLEILGSHERVYFGRSSDGELESPFSGNLAEVCPTGVFTDKSLKRHYTRKWDLRTAPSICVHCGVGCNTSPGEHYGTLRRVRPRFNGEVNGYFLCDRGRYGYDFVNAETRIREPLEEKDGAPAPASEERAVGRAADALRSGAALGIGSPRASLETNYALRRLVGAENFFLDVSDDEFRILRLMAGIVKDGAVPSASVRQAGESDACLILGEDPWATAPILALNLRQAALNAPMARAMETKKIPRWDDAALREAIQNEKGPFFIVTPEPSGLDASMAEALRASARETAALGEAIAERIHPRGQPAPLPEAFSGKADSIAAALKAAARPLVVSGCHTGNADVVRCAERVARALSAEGKDVRLALVFPDCNSLGAVLLAAGGIGDAARRAAAGGVRTLVLAEAGLSDTGSEKPREELLGSRRAVVAIAHSLDPLTERSHVVLPAATFAESSGTFVSSEGRAQRFFSVLKPAPPVADGWRWISRIAGAAGLSGFRWEGLDDVISALAEEIPMLAGIKKAAPGAAFRRIGMKIPRDSHRVSGRTSNFAHLDVHEPKPPEDPDSPLAFTMEGLRAPPPPPLIPRFWAPGWNSDQSMNKFQDEVGGGLRGGDPGVRLFEPEGGSG